MRPRVFGQRSASPLRGVLSGLSPKVTASTRSGEHPRVNVPMVRGADDFVIVCRAPEKGVADSGTGSDVGDRCGVCVVRHEETGLRSSSAFSRWAWNGGVGKGSWAWCCEPSAPRSRRDEGQVVERWFCQDGRADHFDGPDRRLKVSGDRQRLALWLGPLGLMDGALRMDVPPRVDGLVADRAADPGRDRRGRGVIVPRRHRVRLPGACLARPVPATEVP